MRNKAEIEAVGRSATRLRRAVAFIHDNAQPISGLNDIAVAVGVIPRSVQYMFRRYLGTTPLEYLRRVLTVRTMIFRRPIRPLTP